MLRRGRLVVSSPSLEEPHHEALRPAKSGFIYQLDYDGTSVGIQRRFLPEDSPQAAEPAPLAPQGSGRSLCSHALGPSLLMWSFCSLHDLIFFDCVVLCGDLVL